MPEDATQYSYSLRFSLGTLILMTLLMMLLLRNVLLVNTLLSWVIYGFCCSVFVFLAVVIVFKRLVPALKGNIALQLDEEGISDYIGDVSINWGDINEIHLLRGRTASMMRVDLKFESDHGSQIIIPLRWVKGKDDHIYETTLAYFEQAPGGTFEADDL